MRANECEETLTDIILVPMMAECGVRTIEGFANEFVNNLEKREMKKLCELFDKSQKMKESREAKHEFNYWKVMQSLGELGIEPFIHALKTNSLHSCPCHVYTNLFEVMNVFCEFLISINVIKRALYHRPSLVPLFFEALRQTKEPKMMGRVLVVMFRYLIVGRGTIVEMYMQHKVLKDVCAIIQKQMDTTEASLHNVEYCVKILYGLAVHGDRHVKQSVKRSQALIAAEEYSDMLKDKKDVNGDSFNDHPIRQFYTKLCTEIEGEKRFLDKQDLREILKQECRSARGHFVFCSAPSCRKQFIEGKMKLRYCGNCRLSRYCSAECQKEHWSTLHKKLCLPLDCFTQKK